MRPTPGSPWPSRACRRRPTRSPPSRTCSIFWPRPGNSRALWSRSMPWAVRWGCQVEIADRIVAHKADYVLTLKGNQPSLEAEVAAYFRTAPAEEIVTTTTVEKGHGRIEIRTYAASSCVDWIRAERSYPGAPRFTSIKTLIQVHRRTEHPDRCTFDTHHYISSAALDIARLAQAVRGHWGVESMHWLLDVA